jgi:hypothetical protein
MGPCGQPAFPVLLLIEVLAMPSVFVQNSADSLLRGIAATDPLADKVEEISTAQVAERKDGYGKRNH